LRGNRGLIGLLPFYNDDDDGHTSISRDNGIPAVRSWTA